MIGERVLVRHFGVEDGFELRPFRRELREFKRPLLPKADEEKSLAIDLLATPWTSRI